MSAPPAPSDRDLIAMAAQVARATARIHPGRPAFTALSRAEQALKDAAKELRRANPTAP